MSNGQQDFMSAMGTILGMAFAPPRAAGGGSNVPYDVLESDKEILIYAEMPGVTGHNLEVDIFNDQLKIGGKKEPNPLPAGAKEDEYTRLKRGINFADPRLSIHMPLAVTNRDNVKVSLKHGLLTIIIDKEAERRNSFKVTVEDS